MILADLQKECIINQQLNKVKSLLFLFSSVLTLFYIGGLFLWYFESRLKVY